MSDEPHPGYSPGRYACRDLQNTDFLAFRELEERNLPSGATILDVGCGSGRSTRFLQRPGRRVAAFDCRAAMISEARSRDPSGDYRLVSRGQPFPFVDAEFDAVFSSWVLLEEGDPQAIVRLLSECRRVVKDTGEAVVVTNTPEFYSGCWLSCAVDHPENAPPQRSGQRVRATLLPERVEVSDYFWTDADYRRFFDTARFRVRDAYYPLGRRDDPLAWRDELTTAPYVIYHLDPAP